MHQGGLTLGVVLGQGEGGACDRFVDAKSEGDALHQGGLAGTELALKQQDCPCRKLAGKITPQAVGGL